MMITVLRFRLPDFLGIPRSSTHTKLANSFQQGEFSFTEAPKFRNSFRRVCTRLVRNTHIVPNSQNLSRRSNRYLLPVSSSVQPSQAGGQGFAQFGLHSLYKVDLHRHQLSIINRLIPDPTSISSKTTTTESGYVDVVLKCPLIDVI